MTFFVSAITEDGKDSIVTEIDAEKFEDAYRALWHRAIGKFAQKPWRITSVTEQPAENPMRYYQAGAVHAEALERPSIGREG